MDEWLTVVGVILIQQVQAIKAGVICLCGKNFRIIFLQAGGKKKETAAQCAFVCTIPDANAKHAQFLHSSSCIVNTKTNEPAQKKNIYLPSSNLSIAHYVLPSLCDLGYGKLQEDAMSLHMHEETQKRWSALARGNICTNGLPPWTPAN